MSYRYTGDTNGMSSFTWFDASAVQAPAMTYRVIETARGHDYECAAGLSLEDANVMVKGLQAIAAQYQQDATFRLEEE